MISHPRTIRRAGAAMFAVLTLASCSLDVTNPSVIDSKEFDPVTDATALSLSAQTNFYDAYADFVNYGAYFSGEAWVGAVRAETNDFGRRVITPGNLDINQSLWAPISLAISSNDKVLEVLAGTAGEDANLNVARSAMNAGFSLLLMGEYFCEGILRVGAPITPQQTLDSAIVRFERAIEVGTAAGGAEATKIVNASTVGLARAYLQKGDNANAATTAATVAPSFEFNAIYSDDPGSRTRVGNEVFGNTAGLILVVPEDYRALDDPRVPFVDAGRLAQDGQLDLFDQTKYTSYAAPIRVASGLEARYIVAEARLKESDPAPALALIAERRLAGGQTAFTGTGTAAILAELMDQRARDFWLEAKHMGDYVRNPTATPYVPPAGTPYYKPGQGNFGNATCVPVPNEERNANPNYPG